VAASPERGRDRDTMRLTTEMGPGDRRAEGDPPRSWAVERSVRGHRRYGVLAGMFAAALPMTAAAQSTITIAADASADNELVLWIDGIHIASSTDWTTGTSFTVSLAPGEHVIAVQTNNSETNFHGGLIADLELAAGEHVVTDGTWRWSALVPADWNVPGFDDSAWNLASVKGPFGMFPWGLSPPSLVGTTASWIGTTSDLSEPGGPGVYFHYRRSFTVAAPDCPVGMFDPSVVGECECPDGTNPVYTGSTRVPQLIGCEPRMEESADPELDPAEPVFCDPTPVATPTCVAQERCAMALCTTAQIDAGIDCNCSVTNADGSCAQCAMNLVVDATTGLCTCPATACPDGYQACPTSNSRLNCCDFCPGTVTASGDPNGCDLATPDCPPGFFCPDTYASTFEPFLLFGDLGVQQCGTSTFRPGMSGAPTSWVATSNTNFTAVQLGSGSTTIDDYLAEPEIPLASAPYTYGMLLQRSYGDPSTLVDYRIDFADYHYQSGTRSLHVPLPAAEETPPGVPGTTFTSPDGLSAATVDKRIDLVQQDLVSVRYHVSIQDLPYDRISGFRFRADGGGIIGHFASMTRVNGDVPGGVDPGTVAGHVYTTNMAHQESIVGELLLPRGRVYTLHEAYVEFMDLNGVRLNEVKIKRPLSVVTDGAGAEDPATDPESFTIDLSSFSGCTLDVYVKISKPAGRILGELALETLLSPAVGPRVTRYSPSYLGYTTANAHNGARLGYYTNGAVRWLTPVAGAADYDYKCISYERWLPTHRSNSFTALIAWPAGFGVGGGWLRWPAHGDGQMDPIDLADALTTGLDRDGFVYLDGPSTILRSNGQPYWPNPDPTTFDGPGLNYPAPIGPLPLFTEPIDYRTPMAYLDGRVDLSGCMTTDDVVSGWARIAGLSSGPRGTFADERGIGRVEVNGALRGAAHGIFRSAIGSRGEYQVVATDGPWQEGNYLLGLRKGTVPDDWQNYYNGELVVNTTTRRTYDLAGHANTDAGQREFVTGNVWIRLQVRNPPCSYSPADPTTCIPNPTYRPFKSPQAFIGSGQNPSYSFSDPNGQTGRYYASSTGSPTVKTAHYLSIVGIADSTVNITLRALVPRNPDGTGQYFWSGFPPLLQVPIRAGTACVDLCVDAATGAVHQGPCDSDDTCQELLNCIPADQCTGAFCEPFTNLCLQPSTPEEGAIDVVAACDDGDVCTAEGCDPIVGCTHTPIACDDGNPCTADVCDSTAGCQHTPITSPECVEPGSACPTGCDDQNPCTVDLCELDGCVHFAGNAGASCSDATGPCALPSTCDGVSAACPANEYVAAGTVCRASAGECDVADHCTGSSGGCADEKSTALCRASTGVCDLAESCDGASDDCPGDVVVADGTSCSDGEVCTDGDVCQVGQCVGGIDQTPPAILCTQPGEPVECTGPDGATATVGASALDTCSSPAVACDTPDGDLYPIGQTYVTCTALDQTANVSTCDATVQVVDTTAPEITCSPDETVYCVGPETTHGLTAIATDLCSPVQVTTSGPSSIIGAGSAVVGFTATDGHGNASECASTVTVIDDTAPVVTCLQEIPVQCAPASGVAVDLSSVIAYDVCDDAPAIVVASGALPTYPPGSTHVTFSAQDQAGNTGMCETTIVVEQAPAAEITGKMMRLWPPSPQYVTMGLKGCIASIVDECNPGTTPAMIASTARIVAYGSDEPSSGPTSTDIVATLGSNTYQVRAQRTTAGNGRVYSIWYEYTNAHGSTSVALCRVGVPSDDLGRVFPIDDGVGEGFVYPATWVAP
jgi:hypothetical protein